MTKVDRREPIERLTIRASGAWTFERGDGDDEPAVADRGCLPEDVRGRFVAAVSAADFRPPRPTPVTCAALPTARIEHRDALGDRVARSARPCGTPPNQDVRNLSTAARMLTVEPQRATAIPLPDAPRTCAPRGEAIATIRRAPIDRNQQAKPGNPGSTFVLYDSGAWVRQKGMAIAARGCLMPDELEAAKTAIDSAELELAPPGEVVCRALPNRELTVTTPRGRVSWKTPCSRSPHESVLELVNVVSQSAAN